MQGRARSPLVLVSTMVEYTLRLVSDSNGKTIVKVEGGSFDGLVPGTKLKTQNLLLPIVRIIDGKQM